MPANFSFVYAFDSWANLFHYILQGLVTNELAESEYHLNVSQILEGVNIDQMFSFDGGNKTTSDQLSSIFALVSEIPVDATPNPENGKLPSLINCTLTKGCFADEEETLSAGFINCYLFSGLFSDPPCNEEFNAVMETVDVVAVGKCFIEDDVVPEGQVKGILSPVPQMESPIVHFEDSTAPISIHRQLIAGKYPGGTNDTAIPKGEEDGMLDFALCMAGALLPADAKNQIMDIVNDLTGIASFVFDVIDKGIYIPGELILFVFGWAEYRENEGFVAPFKWYYCMFAVSIFLIAIEIFKLGALSFIVWTKR